MNETKQFNILVVDDDANYRESVRRLLWTVNESFPVNLREAPGGAQGMDIVKKSPIDCVLLDNCMPGGSGIEWIGRFLEWDAYLPIVMVTGQGDESTAVNAMKQGAMDYLVKGSISAEAIQRAVTNAVEKATMRRTVAKQHEALLIAERHRAMIETLGSACRHIGQPMTVVTECLDVMKRQSWGPKVQELVIRCDQAVGAVNDILDKLQRVSIFRTEPYLSSADDNNQATQHDERTDRR